MPDVAIKKGWTRVGFGNVVKLSGERSRNPEEDGFERFVGLEHIDPGDLKIRRWGDIADGTTFTSVFRPGQVLFGKRRAYQRKVAVANFSGVCSGDIYVLEPKNAHLLPELLPFICQTEAFFEHAVGTSAGSLSPRTNWESLAAYEFALPPLEEQRRSVQVLSAARAMAESYHTIATASSTLRSAMEAEILVGGIERASNAKETIEALELPVGWALVRASSLCSAPVTSGITPRHGEHEPDRSCPFIKVGNLMFDGQLDFGPDDSRLNRSSFDATKSLHVIPGDVLTNIVGPPLGKVSVVPSSMPQALINQAIVRYRPKSPEIGTWLRAYLMSSWAKQWLFTRSKKTSGQRNINATTCASLPVPVPPPSQMMVLVKRLDEVREADSSLCSRVARARSLLANILKETVSP